MKLTQLNSILKFDLWAKALIITICVLGLFSVIFLSQPIFAQTTPNVSASPMITDPEPQARTTIIFPVESVLESRFIGGFVTIQLTNKLNKRETSKKISFVIEPSYGGKDEDRPISLETTRLELNEALGKSIEIPDLFKLTIRNFNWPGGEHSRVSFHSQTNAIWIEDLPVSTSQYHIVVSRQIGGSESEEIFSADQVFTDDRVHFVTLTKPGIWENFKKQYVTNENLLVTAIIGLIGILVAVLKEKVKTAIEWILDGLGRFGSGWLATRRFDRLYLDVISSQHKYLKLIGFNTNGISRPLLEEVFISLRISSFGVSANDGGGENNSDGHQESSVVSFASALNRYSKLVVLGGPGAGKTTTLSHALLVFAHSRGNEEFNIEKELLPIFIPLRRLSNSNRSILDDLQDPETQILPAELVKECPSGYFPKRLAKGNCIVLLDGLDEVVDEGAYRRVADRINSFVSTYPNNQYVVTCRVAGWQSLLTGDFKVLQTQDFSRDEIQRFVLGWHRAVITQSEHSRLRLDIPDQSKFELAWAEHYQNSVKPAIEMRSRSLLRAIDANNRILAIAVNPMLLSLISLVHFIRHLLPHGRTILYSQCIDLLIDSWDRSRDITWNQLNRISPQQKESVLREIAFDFQMRGIGEDSRMELEDLIARTTRRLGISMPASELLEEIESRSGMLSERSIDVFGFTHLTLQEYLVAKHIRQTPIIGSLLNNNFGKQEWREVILVYAGLLDDATELISEVAKDKSIERTVLAGYCIGDAQHCDSAVSAEIVDRLLTVLDSPSIHSSDVVGALAAIASDYIVDANTVEENLSKTLIDLLKLHRSEESEVSAEAVTDWLSILGSARITEALSVIVYFLDDKNPLIREHAVSAVASFGNLALPTLTSYAQHFLDTMPTDTSQPAVLSIIRAGELINTSESALLLISLSNESPQWRDAFSFALARMLINPFIEKDILQETNLPAVDMELITSESDRWFYGDHPVSRSFRRLEGAIVSSLAYFITISSRQDVEITELNSVSFKFLFPATIAVLRAHVFDRKLGRYTWVVREVESVDLLKDLGFINSEDNRLSYLVKQIRKSASMPVEFALQQGKSSRLSDDSFNGSWKLRLANIAGNVFFTVFSIALWIWVFLIARQFYVFRWTGHRLGLLGLIDYLVLSHIILLILAYFLLAILAHIKLGRRVLGIPQWFGSFGFALANFHLVMPYLTRQKMWVKFCLLHSIWFVVSPAFAILLTSLWDYYFRGNSLDISIAAIFMIPNILFMIASFTYFKFFVLAQNPIYQLVLLHPDGKRLMNER